MYGFEARDFGPPGLGDASQRYFQVSNRLVNQERSSLFLSMKAECLAGVHGVDITSYKAINDLPVDNNKFFMKFAKRLDARWDCP